MSQESRKENRELARAKGALSKLLATPGLKLDRIASLLDAEDYLDTQEARGQRGESRSLDAQRFLKDAAAGRQIPQLPDHYIETDTVVLEPGEGEIGTGEGSGIKEKDPIPRTRNVMNLLGEMGESYVLIDGKNRDNMVRKLSYVVFVLEKAKKLLFVNDEDGNATYVVHQFEDNQTWKEYAAKTKDQLRDIAANNPELVSVIEFKKGMDGFLEDLEELIRNTPQKKESRSDEQAPTGWLTTYGISKAVKKTRKWVKNRLDKMTLTDDDIHEYKTGGNQVKPHYSPQIVEQLRVMAEGYEKAPSDWVMLTGMPEILQKSTKWAEPRIAAMSLSSEDEGKYLSSDGSVHTFYSPGVIDRLQAMASELNEAPDGWMAISHIAESIGKSHDWVTARIQSMTIELEDQGEYLLTGGNTTQYYSPLIIERLRKMAAELKQAPEGWMTVADMISELRMSTDKINVMLDGMALGGEDKSRFLDSNQHERDYYSPDVLSRLRQSR